MKVEKVKGGFNEYKLNLSYAELMAVFNAMDSNHADPVGDEVHAGLDFFLNRLPEPGEDDDAHAAQQKAEKDASKAADDASDEFGEIPAETKPAHGVPSDLSALADETLPEPPAE